ncbi:Peptidase family M23 [Fodinibius salinus]|uniref:Peptidase family M23 n=1 Tax=Fodinibius salinus TaxID=860790 RepID=A0A5D3YML7_9BACT|nr:peptidoglycan DD-metalloendopeptidase family protein [Fodinibius salinus]TYP95037.1 Peptidase family M23 [Fodinibius salinus]
MYRIILLSIVGFGIIMGCSPDRPVDSDQSKEVTVAAAKDTMCIPHQDKFGLPINGIKVADYTVKRNESLYLILNKLGFNAQEIYNASRRAKQVIDLDNFKPGQRYRVYFSADSTNRVKKLLWQPSKLEYVVFNWTQDSLEISRAARQLNTKKAMFSGTIENSLYKTIHRQGAHPVLAYKMANIFAWQINFFGLRPGDSFKVLYDKTFVEDEFLGVENILAAEFTHRGETYKAYKFSRGGIDGYFDEEGNSVEKALLKAPFEFNQRISSGYTSSRYHPILKKNMPHRGVDYAAPVGTPVLAVGDGVVTEAQYRGANGNIIKIDHNSTYRTAYLHLHGFADGIHRGASVEQGQIIGYVGSTGRSTGPHLDYRLYKNDRAVNSRTVDLPSSKGIPDSLMDHFMERREALARQLEKDKEKQKITSLTADVQWLVPMYTAAKK